MPLSPASWDRVRALFEAASALDGAGREALIGQAGLTGEALAELRSLLRHHDEARGSGGFLQGPAEPPPPPVAARAGQRLGAWQIVRPLGAGGMGEVFEARRADGSFEGRAAVKLLKRGMDSEAVLQRFALERQALARLNHPHIARLLDAGASDEGLPYFVMEYVDGRPIHEAAKDLPLEARLCLFLQLADAVAHAHRNLLVHRDLKPGNVLVDAQGQVKLLDFGIAKALDPLEGGADGASTTVGGQRPFTPHYASPEQVRGEPVSTATDIYSLGVLLYQLLTGTRPTGRRATTPADAARSVLEETPTRPSRLSADEAADPKWWATRKRLEGDLDNILLKALEKAPQQRYASVDAFAADLLSFLEHRPVSARAPSAGYVFLRFVQRNRWAALAAALGGLGLLGGVAATLLQERVALALGVLGMAAGLVLALVQARRAALARDVAQARLADAKSMLRRLVQQHADAITYLPGGLPAREAMLHDAIERLDELARQAEGDHEIAAALAASYARLADLQGPNRGVSVGKPREAEANARKALGWFARLPAGAQAEPEIARWHANAHTMLGGLAQQRGELPAALSHFEDGIGVLRRALRQRPDDTLLLRSLAPKLGMVGQLHQTVGMPNLEQSGVALRWIDEAAALYDRLIALEHDPADRMHRALCDGGRAVVHQRHDRLDESLACLLAAEGEIAALVHESQGLDMGVVHAHATVLNNLSFVQGRQGRHADALASAALSFQRTEQLREHEPENRAWRQRWGIFGQGYAGSLIEAGRHAEALALLARIEPVWRDDRAAATSPPEQRTAGRREAVNQRDQGRCLLALGRAAEALPRLQSAEQTVASLLRAAPEDRELLLVQGETHAALAQVEPGDSERWRVSARALYDAAARIQALTDDHLRARQALG